VALPCDRLAFVDPHPYHVLGAPYGNHSPFWVRQGVLERLLQAQADLQKQCPGWRLQIFDAYRPLAVQQFMVDYTLAQLVRSRQLQPTELTSEHRHTLLQEVYQFWALPSSNPTTPPPHSTGAALDLTLIDAKGTVVAMGSPIDELSPRSHPEHFANQTDPASQAYHHQRQVLRGVMIRAGFQQHPQEWWHFSWGDQLWAWLAGESFAHYGRVEKR
jgi:D-alanyl-D-alanine dipeptidase